MRTLVDVAAFLKRNPGRELTVSYNERQKRFEVTYDRTPATSKYLDDALEGLSETLRRKDSGMTLKEAAQINPAYQLKNNIAAGVNTSLGMIPPQFPAWAQQTGSQHFRATQSYPLCPQCGNFPVGFSQVGFNCTVGHFWANTPSTGDVAVNAAGSVFLFDGVNWNLSP